jgi:GntR family transcriptional regulator/MocR family aminotransferase
VSRPAAWRPFQLDATDIALFPREAWSRLLQRSWREHGAAMLGPPDAFGWPPLRAAIAGHLQAWRGIPCDAGRIIVTSGIADAMEIIAAIAFRAGDPVLVEDPGFPLIRHGLARLGLRPVPGLVDQQGLDVARALGGAAGRDLRGVFVAPSRHYPLGTTLPIGRRLALLDWAAQHGGIVVEDDYDGEYRYVGAPLPALSGLDRGGRVLYVGSFSKVLSRALRLGFLVLPDRLVPAARAHLARRGASAGIVAQPALAGFIASGDYAAHIRRTRRIYARRLQALVEAGRRWSAVIEVLPTDSGMHALARLGPSLPDALKDREAAALALAAGVEAAPLSAYATQPGGTRMLLLGFAAFREEALGNAMDRLGAALSRVARGD